MNSKFRPSLFAIFAVWLFALPDVPFGSMPYSTIVEDVDGQLIWARIADDGQWRFPPVDSVPDKFTKALIQYEDRTFYRHLGVSIKGIVRAAVDNVRAGRVVSGGSTITMQVVRMMRRGKRTVWEKIVECFMATRLEARYTKYEILCLYASHAPFGGNVVGIEAARWRYFGTSGTELSWAEAATLAVLQNAPSDITPSKNRDALLRKRNRLLKQLYAAGDITQVEYSTALAEPLIDTPHPLPDYAPHLMEWYDAEQHGKRIRTGIRLDMQRMVEETTTAWSRQLRRSGINDMAAVVADVMTGEVIAYCGNADFGYIREGRWVDIARRPRSSGSILKPLLYAAALQEGIVLPWMLIDDMPTDIGGFAPKNFDGQYRGVVRADEALSQSLNVPSVAILRQYGVHRFIETLQEAGINTLSRPATDYGLSVILGAAEVSLLDITLAYAAMARQYLTSDTAAVHASPITDRIALYQTFDAMRKVNRPDQIDWRRVSKRREIAWKTGTSFGCRDAWAVGFDTRYAVGVWVGNADGSAASGITGALTAGPVMFDIFGALPGSPWFAAPDNTEGVIVEVCAHSGHRAGHYCSDKVEKTVPKKGATAAQCPYCRRVILSHDRNTLLNVATDDAIIDTRFVLPPHIEQRYMQHHPEYHPLPPLSTTNYASSAMHTAQNTMRFVYPPTSGAVVKIPRLLNGESSNINIRIAHADAHAQLFWYVDKHYIGTTTHIHNLAIALQPGPHTISATDHTGRQLSTKIVVIAS